MLCYVKKKVVGLFLRFGMKSNTQVLLDATEQNTTQQR